MPRGAGEDTGHRVERLAVGDPGHEQDAAQRALGTHVEQVRGDVEARCGLVVGAVDGAEPVEEGEALVARGLEGGAPRPGLDHARLVSHVGSLSRPVPAPPTARRRIGRETAR